MALRTCDIVPISEARAKLTELAEEVVKGAEKVLTKGGASFVALVDARKLDYYHALEAEYGHMLVLNEAEIGLKELANGQVIEGPELDSLLVK